MTLRLPSLPRESNDVDTGALDEALELMFDAALTLDLAQTTEGRDSGKVERAAAQIRSLIKTLGAIGLPKLKNRFAAFRINAFGVGSWAGEPCLYGTANEALQAAIDQFRPKCALAIETADTMRSTIEFTLEALHERLSHVRTAVRTLGVRDLTIVSVFSTNYTQPLYEPEFSVALFRREHSAVAARLSGDLLKSKNLIGSKG